MPPKKARANTAPTLRSEEGHGLKLLQEAAPAPFGDRGTRYLVLGDGAARRAARALRALTRGAPPDAPIVSIDPHYARAKKAAPAGVKLVGQKAEAYRLTPAQFAGASHVVLVAHHAHTPAWRFLSRLRAAAKGAPVYAAVQPCCLPGLRKPSEAVGDWQLSYPRGHKPPAKRPLAARARRLEAKRAAARKKAMTRFRARQARYAKKRKAAASKPKRRGSSPPRRKVAGARGTPRRTKTRTPRKKAVGPASRPKRTTRRVNQRQKQRPTSSPRRSASRARRPAASAGGRGGTRRRGA